MDLYRLVQSLQSQGLHTPLLIRFLDIIGDRIRKLNVGSLHTVASFPLGVSVVLCILQPENLLLVPVHMSTMRPPPPSSRLTCAVPCWCRTPSAPPSIASSTRYAPNRKKSLHRQEKKWLPNHSLRTPLSESAKVPDSRTSWGGCLIAARPWLTVPWRLVVLPQGVYQGVFPVKCNHDKDILRSIVEYGEHTLLLPARWLAGALFTLAALWHTALLCSWLKHACSCPYPFS